MTRRLTSFTLNHASLIEHGFDFLCVAEVTNISSEFPTWEVVSMTTSGWTSIGPSGVSTSIEASFSQKVAAVYLRYTVNKTGEHFILVLSISYDAPHLSIVIPDPLAKSEDSIENTIQQRINTRIKWSSKLLPSGKSVSVAHEGCHTQGIERHFTAEIVIDPGGEFRWPGRAHLANEELF